MNREKRKGGIFIILIWFVLLCQSGCSESRSSWEFINKKDFQLNVLMPRIKGSERIQSTNEIERITEVLFREFERISQDSQLAGKLVAKYYKEKRSEPIRGHLTIQFPYDFSEHIYELDVELDNRSYEVVACEDYSFPELVIEIGADFVTIMVNKELAFLASLIRDDEGVTVDDLQLW